MDKVKYTDGIDVENAILNVVINGNPDELDKYICDWPTLYHFNKSRFNVLKPFIQYLSNKNVLEIGAGCGAISCEVAKIAKKITCVEGNLTRAEIIRHRLKSHAGANVVHENFMRYDTSEKFDAVLLIGVLEYANAEEDAANAELAMLEKARTFLSPGGVILLAIENKIGLKYFGGANEDHHNKPYYGLENKYTSNDARTFSRLELFDLTKKAGFVSKFYGAFPDYKFARYIYDDSLKIEHSEIISEVIYADPQISRDLTSFQLDMAIESISDAGLLIELANSFIVVLSKNEFEIEPFSYYFSDINSKSPKSIKFGMDVCKEKVIKSYSNGTSSHYIYGKSLNFTSFKKITKEDSFEDVVNKFVNYAAVCNKIAGNHLNDPGFIFDSKFVDLIPKNILASSNQFYMIDNEILPYGSELRIQNLIFRAYYTTIYERNIQFSWTGGADSHLVVVQKILKRMQLESRTHEILMIIGLEAELQTQPHDEFVANFLIPLDASCDGANSIAKGEYYEVVQLLYGEDKKLESLVEQSAVQIINNKSAVFHKNIYENKFRSLQSNVKRFLNKLGNITGLKLQSKNTKNSIVDTANSIVATIAPEKKILILTDQKSKISRFELLQNVYVSDSLNDALFYSCEYIFVIENNYTIRDDAIAKCIQMLESDVEEDCIVTSSISCELNGQNKVLFKPEITDTKFPLLKTLSGFVAFKSLKIDRKYLLKLDLENTSLFKIISLAIYAAQNNLILKSLPLPLCSYDLPLNNESELFNLIKYQIDDSKLYSGAMKSKSLSFIKTDTDVILRPDKNHDENHSSMLVVIPFKNQFALTLRCIAAVRRYIPNAKILTINNNSEKSSALLSIKQMSDECIDANFPYNYSLLHNFALDSSTLINDAKYIMFLNNDVILQDECVSRMLDWFIDPIIGAVGCKLYYPDGRIQFGGVGYKRTKAHGEHGWFHVDQPHGEDRANLSRLTYSAHSLTCACAILRKEIYMELGGFDYKTTPIGFSDANLFLRARALGYTLIYDGTVSAVHHESVSRGVAYNDDMEAYLSSALMVGPFSNLTIEIL